jgi:hypothetical protein
MKKFAVCAVLVLAGCAKMPEDVAPVSVAVDPYMQMACPDLTNAKIASDNELTNLEAEQKKTAQQDAASMSIIHVPLASIRGLDKSSELANAKGRAAAISQAYTTKNCAAASTPAPVQ